MMKKYFNQKKMFLKMKIKIIIGNFPKQWVDKTHNKLIIDNIHKLNLFKILINKCWQKMGLFHLKDNIIIYLKM